MRSNIHSFGYYFLNNRLHPTPPPSFKTSIVLLIVNKNLSENHGKFLFVQQGSRFWNLPKEGIKSNLADNLFSAIAKNLEEEIGLKGIKVSEVKPSFKQVAIIFDFDKQKYDKQRAKSESQIAKPIKGKIYHLAIMEFQGQDNLKIEEKSTNPEIINLKWANKEEGNKLMLSNKSPLTFLKISSPHSVNFNIKLFKKIISFYENLSKITSARTDKQTQLF